MKIIYNHIIPFPGFVAINLFGVLFVRSEYKGKIGKTTINHESIHTAQMKELWYIGFYLLYFFEWIVRLFQYGCKDSKAYYNIRFEIEAYANEDNMKYLDTRQPFNWKNYA